MKIHSTLEIYSYIVSHLFYSEENPSHVENNMLTGNILPSDMNSQVSINNLMTKYGKLLCYGEVYNKEDRGLLF